MHGSRGSASQNASEEATTRQLNQQELSRAR
jgi:hypothetical protein